MANPNPLEQRFEKPANWLRGTFTNARGLALHYGQLAGHKKPLAHIVYVAGLSEYTEKTFELARDFNKHACNFSVFDRPGQGRSPRLLPDREKQHSTGNLDSVRDVIDFCKKHVPAGEPIVLLGHSTGGLIALQAMQQEPELFKAAIMTAPLWGFANPILKNKESYFARLPLPHIAAESYAPGNGPWLRRDNPKNPEGAEAFSGDPARNKIHDYWMTKDPVLKTGGPTCGWVSEKCRGIVRIQNAAFLKKIKQPVLVFTAGQDHLVNNDRIEAVIKKLPNAQRVHFKDGHHELLMEKDEIRDRLLFKDALPFLKKNLK
jgi:lysophospholipase